jgi:DNA polymerase III gamma/tau subunit
LKTASILDVTEMDAASNNALRMYGRFVRGCIYTSAVKRRVYIIDEVHMLSNSPLMPC